jgi:hypothetical protein
MASIINATTSTGLVSSADNSGVIQLQSNGTTALTVNTNEGIQILNCLGVGNATPSTSGAGITFPGTQSASSDANTLDDYEEGTWTPTIAGISTYTVQNATYIKIGKYVHIAGDVSGTDSGSLASFVITSFPFVSQGTPTVYGIGNVFPVSGFTSNATSTVLQGTPGQTQGIVYWVSSGGTNFNQITSSDLAATFTFEFSLSYLATA